MSKSFAQSTHGCRSLCTVERAIRRSRRPMIAPSILSADYADLAGEIARVEAESDLLHVDIMDGHFVPTITIGPPVVRAIRHRTALFLDCHLMVDNPATLLEPLADAGADGCSVHVELGDPTGLIARMRDLGLHPGLVVNPETPLAAAAPYLHLIDPLLVMSVHPGRGGQAFIPEVLPKLTEARRIAVEGGLRLDLQVDGGVSIDTAPLAVAAGAAILVAGSAIFETEDSADSARRIRAAGAAAREPEEGTHADP